MILKQPDKKKSQIMHPKSQLNPEDSFHASTTNFVRAIKAELEGGRGFAPFVGSGISAQSGILMSQDFSDYLAFCVWKVLGSPRVGKMPQAEGGGFQPWDLVNVGWPPHPSSEELEHAKEYLCHVVKMLGTQYHFEVSLQAGSQYLIEEVKINKDVSTHTGDQHLRRPLVPEVLRGTKLWAKEEDVTQQRKLLRVPDQPWDINLSRSSKSYIEEVAIRALSHWPLTLEFLAKTRVDSSKKCHLLYLEEIDIAIIDSFNQHITRGKQPNLIHNLLARLARSLRTRVILSTNFDCLLENAFASQDNPISVLSVSVNGGLPAYSTVRAQDCLVKLHGDLLETRADSSINTPPAELDKSLFFQYLRGPAHPHRKAPIEFVPSHLLILGYSASDARCIQMIKYVLDLDKDFKVFWVCHTEHDHKKVNAIFKDYLGMDKRFHIVVTDRTDLLLWELYQVINLSLPGGGYRFKFTDLVPPASVTQPTPISDPACQTNPANAGRETLIREVERTTGEGKVMSIDFRSGIVALARDLFQDFAAKGKQVLWFELEDHRNALEFLWECLGAISLRLGSFNAEAVNFMPHELLEATQHFTREVPEAEHKSILSAIKARVDLLCDRYGIVPDNWVLFLYGRNGLGGGSGWQANYWSATEQNFFAKLLKQLAELRFRIVYMPHGTLRTERNYEKVQFVQELASTAPFKKIDPSYMTWLNQFGKLSCPVAMPKFETYCNELSELDQGEFPRMQRPRYQTMLNDIVHGFCYVGEKHSPIISARIIWLYGLTLFRQSRNSTAMISESVFPCPWKFNLNSLDNDEIRFKHVFEGVGDEPTGADFIDDAERLGWSNWLEKVGLFLRKPGGFSWVYRDTRLAIQYLLERLGPVPLYAVPLTDTEARLPPKGTWRSLWELRPRIHYWIAEWYLKAFHSTGHYTPLVEVFHHAALAIQLSPNYKAPMLEDHDQLGTSKVHVAWSSLCLFRQALKDGRQCFLYWCPGINIQTIFFDQLELLREPMEELKRTLPKSRLAKRLAHDLKKDGLLEAEIKELTATVIAEGYSDLRKPAPGVRRMDPDLLEGRGDGTGRYAMPPDKFMDFAASDAIWCESVWNNLKSLFASYADGVEDFPEDSIFGLHRHVKRLRFKWIEQWDEQSANFDDLFELAWGLSSLTYDFLRRAKLIFHSKDGDLGAPKLRWGQICVLAHHSLLLCRLLPPRFDARERELQVRLLSTYGLALGCLGRGRESNRRFHEAHALALSQPGEALPLQQARIQLRRAEMYLYRAHKADDINPFVHIDDAWAAIERGEHALSGKNHSSFWWYRIAVTKLSCLAVLAETCISSNSDGKAALPMRRRQQLPSVIEVLLKEALFAADGDDFRSLRAADYAQVASKLSSPGLCGGDHHSPLAEQYKTECATEKPRPLFQRLQVLLKERAGEDGLLQEYRSRVRLNYTGGTDVWRLPKPIPLGKVSNPAAPSVPS